MDMKYTGKSNPSLWWADDPSFTDRKGGEAGPPYLSNDVFGFCLLNPANRFIFILVPRTRQNGLFSGENLKAESFNLPSAPALVCVCVCVCTYLIYALRVQKELPDV